MSVSAITNSTASTTATSSTNTLDKNTFLKLLTTQLKNQDPLNPMDSTAFTAQLAQFSSLEQLTNVNTNLSSLITSQNTLLHGMSVNLIGKTVTTKDGTSGTVTGISFDGDTTNVVLDSNKTVSLTNITKISS